MGFQRFKDAEVFCFQCNSCCNEALTADLFGILCHLSVFSVTYWQICFCHLAYSSMTRAKPGRLASICQCQSRKLCYCSHWAVHVRNAPLPWRDECLLWESPWRLVIFDLNTWQLMHIAGTKRSPWVADHRCWDAGTGCYGWQQCRVPASRQASQPCRQLLINKFESYCDHEYCSIHHCLVLVLYHFTAAGSWWRGGSGIVQLVRTVSTSNTVAIPIYQSVISTWVWYAVNSTAN